MSPKPKMITVDGPMKERVTALVDKLFEAAEVGQYTELELAVACKFIVSMFDQIGVKPIIVHRGGKN